MFSGVIPDASSSSSTASVVELREEKTVRYDGKITVDLPSRGFLEVPNNLPNQHINKSGEHKPTAFVRLAI